MAANVAHHTATFDAKPSIFDVIAQKSLNELLHPAFRKLALFLATANPRRFGWLAQYHDEVFVILNGLLQHHYLKTKDAGFAEHFYGLRRVPLSDTDRTLSLLCIVVLPYLKRKIDEKAQIYKLELAEQSQKGVCKRLLVASYGLYEVLYRSFTFVQYLSYMSNCSEYQSVSLRLLRIKLAYASTTIAPTFWSLQSFLELLAFLMQFLQMWNEERSNYNFGALPSVPAPPLDCKAGDYKGRCPLCLQAWKIPTVLPVSGYVFCFPCIIKHLQGQQRCPVTGLPAKPLDVVRLYDSDNM